MQLVPQGIHGLPESRVAVSDELTFHRQPLHGLTFPDGAIPLNVINDLGREDEKATIHPGAIALGFFFKGEDLVAAQVEGPKAPRRLDGGQGGKLAMFPMEGDLGSDIHVAEAVAIGEAKVLAVEIGPNAFQATAGHRLFARVNEGNAPRLGMLFVDLHAVGAQIEGHVGQVQEVVGEVLLDHIALVATADDEVVDAVGRIELHDVPEDRFAADLDHGLGLEVGFFRDTGAETTREDDGFHNS